MSNESLNIPRVSVETLVYQLETLFCGIKKNGGVFSSVPTPFLWGPPGVGKSQAVYQIADYIASECDVKVNVVDVRLLLFSPIDLRGIPTANEDKTLAVWLKPQIFQMDPGDDTVNILFLDELSSAPQSVQASAYQICLDRKIGEHKLPENCIVIAAGNRTTDQSVSYKMPKALCNRLMHFEVKPDFESWKHWAVKKGLSEKVIAYLSFDNSRLCVEPDSSELAYPTPRSWEFVSNLIASCDDLSNMELLISGCVGNDTAIEFITYCNGFLSLPSVQKIMQGVCREYPKKHDQLFALCSALVSAVSNKREEITQDELSHIFDYVKLFPADYVMSFIKDILLIDGVKSKLRMNHAFSSLAAKHKISY